MTCILTKTTVIHYPKILYQAEFFILFWNHTDGQSIKRSIARWYGRAYCWRRVQADTYPMSVICWASVAGVGQYPFSPRQYFMLAGVRANSINHPNAVYDGQGHNVSGIGLMHVTPTHCWVNGWLA